MVRISSFFVLKFVRLDMRSTNFQVEEVLNIIVVNIVSLSLVAPRRPEGDVCGPGFRSSSGLIFSHRAALDVMAML